MSVDAAVAPSAVVSVAPSPPLPVATADAATAAVAPKSAAAVVPASILVDGRRCFARLHGIIVEDARSWHDGIVQPAECPNVQFLVHKLPAYIGRKGATIPAECCEDNFFGISSLKVSRIHAEIDFNARDRRFYVTCKSRNGMEVNGAPIMDTDRVLLPEKSTLRIGPLYCYFLLPLASVAEAQATAIGGAGAVEAKQPRRRLERTYHSMLDAIYEKHFRHGEGFWGYFHVGDAVARIRAEFGAVESLPETDDAMRKSVAGALKRDGGAGYASCEAAALPAAVREAIVARVPKKVSVFFCKADVAAAEAARQSAAATGAAGAAADAPAEATVPPADAGTDILRAAADASASAGGGSVMLVDATSEAADVEPAIAVEAAPAQAGAEQERAPPPPPEEGEGEGAAPAAAASEGAMLED